MLKQPVVCSKFIFTIVYNEKCSMQLNVSMQNLLRKILNIIIGFYKFKIAIVFHCGHFARAGGADTENLLMRA